MKARPTGAELRAARKELGFTVSQLAELLSIHPGTLKRFEGMGHHELPKSRDMAARFIDGLVYTVATITNNQEKSKLREFRNRAVWHLTHAGYLSAVRELTWFIDQHKERPPNETFDTPAKSIPERPRKTA